MKIWFFCEAKSTRQWAANVACRSEARTKFRRSENRKQTDRFKTQSVGAEIILKVMWISLTPSNIVLSSTPWSSKWSPSLRCPYKTQYAHPLAIRATSLAHLSFLELINRMIFDEENRAWSSLLCCLLLSPVTLSLSGPNILLSTIFSNILSLHSALSVSGQVPHAYNTTGKIRIKLVDLIVETNFIYNCGNVESEVRTHCGTRNIWGLHTLVLVHWCLFLKLFYNPAHLSTSSEMGRKYGLRLGTNLEAGGNFELTETVSHSCEYNDGPRNVR